MGTLYQRLRIYNIQKYTKSKQKNQSFRKMRSGTIKRRKGNNFDKEQ